MAWNSAVKAHLVRSNSGCAGNSSMAVFNAIDALGGEIPGTARVLLDALQPVDPLRSVVSAPEIDILIPFVLKDLEVLGQCAKAAVASCRNPVRRVRLVTPLRTRDRDSLTLDATVSQIQENLSLSGVAVGLEYDEDVVDDHVLATISAYGLVPRYRGWMTAQTVKLSGALNSEASATLVVDSDTLLSHCRTWVDNNGLQLLMIGQESREAFFNYANEFLGLTGRPRLSFVTHHQLMQKSILEEIFPSGASDIVRWLSMAEPKNGDYSEGGLRVAEYELYGAFLDTVRPERRRYATWGNSTGVRNLDSADLVPEPWALSTSFHHYRSRDNTPDHLF